MQVSLLPHHNASFLIQLILNMPHKSALQAKH